MKEAVQSVFLILGAAGEHGAVDHTIVELPSRVAGDIVGQDLLARLKSGGIADRTYFRIVSPSA
jgi:hypothetical protein